jgi:hypothetical protein
MTGDVVSIWGGCNVEPLGDVTSGDAMSSSQKKILRFYFSEKGKFVDLTISPSTRQKPEALTNGVCRRQEFKPTFF